MTVQEAIYGLENIKERVTSTIDQEYIVCRLQCVIEDLQRLQGVGCTNVDKFIENMISQLSTSLIDANWVRDLQKAVLNMVSVQNGSAAQFLDNEPKIKRLVDGETVTKVGGDLCAAATVIAIIVCALLRGIKGGNDPDFYDRTSFIVLAVTSGLTILVSMVARILNAYRKKHYPYCDDDELMTARRNAISNKDNIWSKIYKIYVKITGSFNHYDNKGLPYVIALGIVAVVAAVAIVFAVVFTKR